MWRPVKSRMWRKISESNCEPTRAARRDACREGNRTDMEPLSGWSSALDTLTLWNPKKEIFKPCALRLLEVTVKDQKQANIQRVHVVMSQTVSAPACCRFRRTIASVIMWRKWETGCVDPRSLVYFSAAHISLLGTAGEDDQRLCLYFLYESCSKCTVHVNVPQQVPLQPLHRASIISTVGHLPHVFTLVPTGIYLLSLSCGRVLPKRLKKRLRNLKMLFKTTQMIEI